MTAAAQGGLGDLVVAVLPALTVADKSALLAALAAAAAEVTDLAADAVLTRVQDREALGSTGFGRGTAIPHARIPGLARVVAVVARLARPVDYGALDQQPVDIAVLLLSPEAAGADHLKALARISRALRSAELLIAWRAAPDAGLAQAIVGLPQAA